MGEEAEEEFSAAMAAPRRVPPRWLDCPRKGKLLGGKRASTNCCNRAMVYLREVSSFQNSAEWELYRHAGRLTIFSWYAARRSQRAWLDNGPSGGFNKN